MVLPICQIDKVDDKVDDKVRKELHGPDEDEYRPAPRASARQAKDEHDYDEKSLRGPPQLLRYDGSASH